MFRTLSVCILIAAYIFHSIPYKKPNKPEFSHFYDLELSDTEQLQYFIKNMTNHAINGYLDYAYPYDVLDPIEGNGVSWSYGGYSTLLTLFDSLDTLYLLKMPQYKLAKKRVLAFDINSHVNTFEFIAKVVGGLISMYELTNEKEFLIKAEKLGKVLSNYDYLPPRVVDFSNGNTFQHEYMSLSFIGSRQLEMSRLSQLTRNESYFIKASTVYDVIFSNTLQKEGLFPSTLDKTGQLHFFELYNAGAGLDSFYETLYKVGIHRMNATLISHALTSLDAIYFELKRQYYDYTYIASEVHLNQFERGTLDHYTCFFGSIYAQASISFNNQTYLQFAKDLADGCFYNYIVNPTKLGPSESEAFVPLMDNNYYKLGSELIETNYVLYKITKNATFAIRNYQIAKQIDKYCKTEYGYAPVNVLTGEYMPPQEKYWINTLKKIYHSIVYLFNGQLNWDQNDYTMHSQESGFISKTLKYLYLTFDNDFDFEKYLFTTQAHLIKK